MAVLMSSTPRTDCIKSNPDQDMKLTVKAVKMAVRALKRQNAPKIDGWYVGIIHPDIAYDLMEDPEWKEWHKYTNPDNAYQNEIGEIGGVRFVESTEARSLRKRDQREPAARRSMYIRR